MGTAQRLQIIIPTIFMVVSLMILLGLGTWQMQRHAWKQDILQTLRMSLQAGPVTYQTWKQNTERSQHQDHKEENFEYVRLKGQLLTANTVFVYAVRSGRLGAWVLTPLQLEDGKTIFVNLGFVVQEQKEQLKQNLAQQNPIKPDFAPQGLIRHPEPIGFLTPEPDVTKKLWYTLNPAEINKTLQLGNLETQYYLQADHLSPQPLQAPISLTGYDPRDFVSAIPNRHFEYAWTWYGIALTLIGVYVALIWGKIRNPA